MDGHFTGRFCHWQRFCFKKCPSLICKSCICSLEKQTNLKSKSMQISSTPVVGAATTRPPRQGCIEPPIVSQWAGDKRGRLPITQRSLVWPCCMSPRAVVLKICLGLKHFLRVSVLSSSQTGLVETTHSQSPVELWGVSQPPCVNWMYFLVLNFCVFCSCLDCHFSGIF